MNKLLIALFSTLAFVSISAQADVVAGGSAGAKVLSAPTTQTGLAGLAKHDDRREDRNKARQEERRDDRQLNNEKREDRAEERRDARQEEHRDNVKLNTEKREERREEHREGKKAK